MRLDIAIIGSPKEPEVAKLTANLAQRGYPPLIIDTAAFPQQRLLTFADGSWWYQKVNLADVKVFFLRNLHCSELMEKLEGSEDPQSIAITALREKDSMLGSLLRWATEQGKPILNPLETLLCHYYKIDTVERLRQAGVPVPPMIATNDADIVRAFARTHKHIVCKPLAGGGIAIGLSANGILEEFYALLKIAPVMLQARIHGHDIRAYVLNNQVVAAASTWSTQLDFRTGAQHFEPTALTQAEAIGIVHATQLMSLRFAGIDFKRTVDGQYFVLDVNPAPMFAGFEQITGLEMTDPIAEYLVTMRSSPGIHPS